MAHASLGGCILYDTIVGNFQRTPYRAMLLRFYWLVSYGACMDGPERCLVSALKHDDNVCLLGR